MLKTYDFSGWATKCNVRCSDGRTIKKNAFKDCDGETVPLVWNHDHKDPFNVLGHALLENRDDGVYAYCSFNDTEQGRNAKVMVEHGDIRSLSIYANQLKQNGGDVIHGIIREVSLVLAGANRGAVIENILSHSGELDGEQAVIFNNVETLDLYHSEEKTKQNMENEKNDQIKENENEDKKEDEETVGQIFDTLNEKQKKASYALIGQAYEEGYNEGKNAKGEENKENMKHNVFENENQNGNDTLVHSEDVLDAIATAKEYGSMKKAFIAHGIDNIEYLFPDAHDLNNGRPVVLRNNPNGWVKKVMNGIQHSPFARVKMVLADISGEEARAKGYVKGDQKEDSVFALLRRKIEPQTVYVHQSIDRDDEIDITDLNVVAWIKVMMREKIEEEIARAILFGDGRSTSSRQKIKETNIIPVIKDTEENLYAIKHEVDTSDYINIIDGAILGQTKYEGSGHLTGFFKNSDVSKMLLLKDKLGHRFYKNLEELATGMGIDEIVKVPDSIVPDGYVGVLLDLTDYCSGADKGGAVNLFDDFDIDFNKEKYLMETRCSGGLTKPRSAIVLTVKATEPTVKATEPTDN